MNETPPDSDTPNHRTARDKLLYEALGDLGRLDEEIRKLPGVMRESLAPSLAAIAKAMNDGQTAINDYAKSQEPTVKAFAATELAGMRKAFAETSADLVAMVKKDLAEATRLHQSAVRQVGYREPWAPWHWIVFALLIAAAGSSGYAGISAGVSAIRDNGYREGKAAGYSQAVDAKTAAAWANTEDGKLAYQLYLAGSLRTIAECKAKNWHIENGACFGYPAGILGGDGWYTSPRSNSD